MPGDGLRYPILLETLEYDGEVTYSATAPDLPGCVAAGDSPEEALSHVKRAIEIWIADAHEQGLSIPEPRHHSGRFTVRVPSWLHAELEVMAQLENVSLNQYVSSILAEHAGMRKRPSSWSLRRQWTTGETRVLSMSSNYLTESSIQNFLINVNAISAQIGDQHRPGINPERSGFRTGLISPLALWGGGQP